MREITITLSNKAKRYVDEVKEGLDSNMKKTSSDSIIINYCLEKLAEHEHIIDNFIEKETRKIPGYKKFLEGEDLPEIEQEYLLDKLIDKFDDTNEKTREEFYKYVTRWKNMKN